MRLIDGDALSEWLKDYGQKVIRGERGTSLVYVWKHVQDMPTVRLERKKGRWIEYTDCEGKSRRITCDHCDHEEWNWLDPNFCPNCGADMRGEVREYLEYGKLIAKGIAQGLRGEQDGSNHTGN